MSENFEKGIKVFAEVYGPEQAQGLRDFVAGGEGFGVKQAEWSMEWAFGQVWTREAEMSRRDRSLAVLGMMIGLRSFEEIRYHTKMGIANGLTLEVPDGIVTGGEPVARRSSGRVFGMVSARPGRRSAVLLSQVLDALKVRRAT